MSFKPHLTGNRKFARQSNNIFLRRAEYWLRISGLNSASKTSDSVCNRNPSTSTYLIRAFLCDPCKDARTLWTFSELIWFQVLKCVILSSSSSVNLNVACPNFPLIRYLLGVLALRSLASVRCPLDWSPTTEKHIFREKKTDFWNK